MHSNLFYKKDAGVLNRVTEIHRPNGISTYNGRDQIVELKNVCDDCEWVVSQYSYIYDDRGFIVGETAIESLAGYACGKHVNCKYVDCGHDECGRTDGKHGDDCKHKDFYPHGTKHAKHCKDGAFGYRIVETDRTFTYDDAGKLLSVVETIDDCGTFTYTYEYDLMGNRTSEKKVNACGKVAEWNRYVYNDSNQLVSESTYDGKRVTCIKYLYDADGNRTAEITKAGCKKEKVTYEYGVENRLEAVYEGGRLLCAMAYDGDGNRVFQLNYNLHTDEEWKCHHGSGCDKNHDGGSCGQVDKDDCKPENGRDDRNTNGGGAAKEGPTDNKDSASKNTSTYCLTDKEEKAEEKEDAYRCGIHFPVNAKVSQTERELISKVKNCGKQNYELIEYINDVNREYTEVLVEQNIFGKTDTSYVYGVDRLSLDRYNGCSGYYLYDPRGSVTGITNERGQLYQSYRYDANGGITYGAPQYENEYTYNGESYNPNIESQYLRARYYDVVTANFLTEDTYLGNIIEPLTLNRYNYCVSSPLNYVDPSGNYTYAQGRKAHMALQEEFKKMYSGTMYQARTEVTIHGYEYSKTGLGYIDMVLTHPGGSVEVYEIKPLSDKTSVTSDGIHNFWGGIWGVAQREGYVEALINSNIIVNNSTTFNPSGWTISIDDSTYQSATYYTFPEYPGMIYYKLNKKKKRVEVPVKTRAKEAGKKNQNVTCLETARKVTDIAAAGLALNYVAEILTSLFDTAEAVTSSWFPFFIIPDMYDFVPYEYQDKVI